MNPFRSTRQKRFKIFRYKHEYLFIQILKLFMLQGLIDVCGKSSSLRELFIRILENINYENCMISMKFIPFEVGKSVT